MEHVFHNATHQAYLNLVDGAADLIFVANPPSEDVLAYADAAGVTLEWKPLALDALVILINTSNAVRDLTVDQIRSIFMAEITRWNEVGGNNCEIHPYVRPINSGSQQLFNAIVMEGLTMPEWPEDRTIGWMGALINNIIKDELSIGYSVYYYVNYQIPSTELVVEVNGVTPSAETIASGEYPFGAPVLAVIRSDLDPGSLAHRLHDWLLTTYGQNVVGYSGYVPLLP
jgi:phosphate transport system substrate-binding protein